MVKWEKVGQISVDAGLCWIGDPCYIMHKDPNAEEDYDKPPKAIGKNWSEFCDNLGVVNTVGSQCFNHDKDIAGLGVVTSTGCGDGVYDVFVQKSDGQIKAVKVVFID